MTSTIKLDPGFWSKTSWIQLFYGVWVNMSQLAIGMAFGLPAVQVPQLSKPNSTIKVTREEAAWIASVLTLFSPIGCLISGYLMDKFGRKIMLIVCQGPMCLGWLYTGCAASAKHIIIGRAITGIGCGMAMGPPRLYTTEISLPNMRGVVGAFSSTAISIGICVQAGLGTLGFAWQVLCFVCSAFTLCNLVAFNLLPETPYYVLKTSTIENARLTLAKFRDKNYDIDKEMVQLIEFKMDNNIRKLTFRENLNAMCTRSACKPFAIINTYILFAQASGNNAILLWAIEILTVAKSSFDPHAGNLLLAISRLCMSIVTSILLFRVGRKPMALSSAGGLSVVCFCLGFYIYYNDDFSIVPQICLMAYIGFASLGYYILPYLMMAELYPLQVRGTLAGITVSFTSVVIFGSSKVYPLLSDSIGLPNTIVLYGACSLLCTGFLYMFLPETKDLTLQEIEEYYNERRSTLVSQRLLISMQLLEASSKSLVPANSKSKSLRRSVHGKRKFSKLTNSSMVHDEFEGKQNLTKENNEHSHKIDTDILYTDSSMISIDLFKNKEAMRSNESLKSEESDTGKKSEESVKSKKAKKSEESVKSKESKKIKESVKSKESKSKSIKKQKAKVVIRGSHDDIFTNTNDDSTKAKDQPSTDDDSTKTKDQPSTDDDGTKTKDQPNTDDGSSKTKDQPRTSKD